MRPNKRRSVVGVALLPCVWLSHRYGDFFGRLLLVIDLSLMPKGEAAEVSACSKFEAEKEVLILPWLRFRVTSVRAFDDDEQSRWQAVQAVHLAYAGSCFDPAAPVGGGAEYQQPTGTENAATFHDDRKRRPFVLR